MFTCSILTFSTYTRRLHNIWGMRNLFMWIFTLCSSLQRVSAAQSAVVKSVLLQMLSSMHLTEVKRTNFAHAPDLHLLVAGKTTMIW